MDKRIRAADEEVSNIRRFDERSLLLLAGLAALAILPYLRALQLPFISDDYIQLALGKKFGSFRGWADLVLDPLYRCRATSLVMTYWTWRIFDLNPLAFNWSGILVHVLNTWLVFGLGAWRFIGWRVAFVAAGFFAVAEGHQEAVIWYAALPELLVFCFSLIAFLAWIAWLQSGKKLHYTYFLSLVTFALALISKESAVVVVPLITIAAVVERVPWRRMIPALIPFGVLAVIHTLLIFAARSNHLFFHDGTFSTSAPFLTTLMISTGRLFWFWGLFSVLVLLALRQRRSLPLVAWAASWIVITFLPYSFLTYMLRVPSRHTYFASAGLAIVVAAALIALKERFSHTHAWIVPTLAFVMIAHNCGYIWTRKQTQYLARAQSTEELLRLTRGVHGPVYVHCFPYGLEIAQLALEISGTAQLSNTPGPGIPTLCLDNRDITYKAAHADRPVNSDTLSGF